jgi:hypothetical protein
LCASTVRWPTWAGIRPPRGVAAFQALGSSLTPAHTPVGDAYLLLQGADRELPVPDTDRRRVLWTPHVWPGGAARSGPPAR